MSDLVQVEGFSPKSIPSGESIVVDLLYSADQAGFIVVNEGVNFDAVPGKIAIRSGVNLRKSVSIRITRQPAAGNKECTIMFTLGASSFAIVVKVQ